MTQTTQHETINPYPTIEDKVALFESHGIKIDDAYEVDASDHYKVDGAVMQILSLAGGKQATVSAIAVAKATGLKITLMRKMIAFNGDGEPDNLLTCYDLMFSDHGLS